jgi:hypothetical protein
MSAVAKPGAGVKKTLNKPPSQPKLQPRLSTTKWLN